MNSVRSVQFEIICVNDGSRDRTLEKLIAAACCDSKIKILDLSRNFGKEAALTAGIEEARGDAVIPIDADLQDPPELIPVLIEHWQNGYDVVLAKRRDRSTDSFLKRKTAELFYQLHNRVATPQIPENVGDFRLIDRCVVEALKRLHEKRRFMKGLFAWVGFKTVTVEYVRQPRATGKTKFSGWKLWNLALEGITSFSTTPLRVWTYIGFMISSLSFAYGLFIVSHTLIYGVDVPGYSSLLTAILFLGGVQLIGIGILGEYIGRIYIELKNRPIYIVRKRYGQICHYESERISRNGADRGYPLVVRQPAQNSASVIEFLDLQPGIDILEIGCGTGGNLPMLCRFGKVRAMEMDAYAREYATAKTGVPVFHGRLPDDLPFGPAEFDLVCLLDVLEHVRDDVAALQSVRFLLKLGGRLLLTVPAYQWLWSVNDQQLHHHRRYTASTLKRCFETAGLRAIKLSYFNTWLFPLACVARGIDKLFRREAASGTTVSPTFLNATFQKVFSSEALLIRKINMPFGVSLLAVLESNEAGTE